jgi:hypothetical protein
MDADHCETQVRALEQQPRVVGMERTRNANPFERPETWVTHLECTPGLRQGKW